MKHFILTTLAPIALAVVAVGTVIIGLLDKVQQMIAALPF